MRIEVSPELAAKLEQYAAKRVAKLELEREEVARRLLHACVAIRRPPRMGFDTTAGLASRIPRITAHEG